ncbi:Outer membrane protein OmpA [Treponema bryantii]|uniref:Outer membrane protein OmpA n=1 Tax=Treponema bryantii TaxID=163 RepID=A0A1I3ICZ7_9SPIR|nr:OmpA family protein [Treponema bryantii]SFI45812.1 Outer membrane protein OmpA [Treponema bryantii]
MSRRFGKLLIPFIVLSVFCSSDLYAEYDSGKFFPTVNDFGKSGLYLEGAGGLAFPLAFTNQSFVPMTSFGHDYSAGLGFNWGGWLLGLEFNRSVYGQGTAAGALMENFTNNLFEFRLRRVISKASISKLPSWLEIVPGISLAGNFITTDYYRSRRAKEDGLMTSITFGQQGARCLLGKLSYENAFYFGNDYFIPYIEGDVNVFYDTSIGGGLGTYFTANIGVRTYPTAIFHKNNAKKEKAVKPKTEKKAKKENKKENKKEPVFLPPTDTSPVELALESNIHSNFTPDDDGTNDKAILTPKLINICQAPQSWKVEILDPKGAEFREYSGEGMLPETVVWDGKSDSGEDVFAMNTYEIVITVIPSAVDIARTGQTELVVKDSITTGLPMQVIIPNRKWKIVVNTIHFDPDRATFTRISKEQQQENIETLDSLAEQIKAHPDCNITIEGYANNVTNTERENREELVPLSQLRAEAILQMLVERGIDKDVFTAKGKGGANPLAAWEDRANWWKNRRVEFIVEKQE